MALPARVRSVAPAIQEFLARVHPRIGFLRLGKPPKARQDPPSRRWLGTRSAGPPALRHALLRRLPRIRRWRGRGPIRRPSKVPSRMISFAILSRVRSFSPEGRPLALPRAEGSSPRGEAPRRSPQLKAPLARGGPSRSPALRASSSAERRACSMLWEDCAARATEPGFGVAQRQQHLGVGIALHQAWPKGGRRPVDGGAVPGKERVPHVFAMPGAQPQLGMFGDGSRLRPCGSKRRSRAARAPA